ncbi:MAG TPA: ISAs1 family transposase [Sphingomicrobium sp.]|nr:ISAs1 family transposase [Sphingomicrobium sp.]
MEALSPAPRLRLLLDHFAAIEDDRAAWRVMYPLQEVLFLVVCASICSCDDYEDIVDWGKARLDFLRRHLEFHWGIPSADWLRTLMNRVDPDLFSACFRSWVAACWPDRPDLVAIDGKTSRRSHDRKAGKAPLHLVSAFATNTRLVLAQAAAADKGGEIAAIEDLLDQLSGSGSLEGALVTIDAVACNAGIAGKIIGHGANYLLAVKANQPSLHGEVERYFADVPHSMLDCDVDVDKDHGRIEDRRVFVSREVDWLHGDRRFPGEHRFPKAAAIVKVETRTELRDRCRYETRFFITSRLMTAKELAQAVRHHWRIENALHWVLDVTFREDLSRLRKGHGARNMAVARHFALNLVRQAQDTRSLKLRRKHADRNPEYLNQILQTGTR